MPDDIITEEEQDQPEPVNIMLEKLIRRLDNDPRAKPELLQDLLDDAKADILAYTVRSEAQWENAFATSQLDLALIRYNRMGMEGELSHSEGGVSRSVELFPDDIKKRLMPYRIALTEAGGSA